MSQPGIALSGLRAVVDPTALSERRLRLQIETVRIVLSAEGLARLRPLTPQLEVERIGGGILYLRVQFGRISGLAEVVPAATSAGRFRLVITGFRAAGFLPIPVSLVTLAARNFAPQRPGFHFGEGNQMEIDLSEILAPAGIEIAPLRATQVEEGLLTLDFGKVAAG